jgi:hypothetical protein
MWLTGAKGEPAFRYLAMRKSLQVNEPPRRTVGEGEPRRTADAVNPCGL